MSEPQIPVAMVAMMPDIPTAESVSQPPSPNNAFSQRTNRQRLGYAVLAYHLVGQFAPRRGNFQRHRIGQSSGKQTGVQRGKRLAFAAQHGGQAFAQCIDIDGLRDALLVLDTIAIDESLFS